MDLDNEKRIAETDPDRMLEQIYKLPEQLEEAWKIGMGAPLPKLEGVRQIVITGMGGSAIGADLVSAYAAPECPLPLYIHRDYDLPAWVDGAETLVIASSHSGNTEETISSYRAALERKCRTLAICTGGELASIAEQNGQICWRFKHEGQPRAAIGFSFGMLLGLITRMGVVQKVESGFFEAIGLMKDERKKFAVDIPTVKNPAKRMAGQLYGRWVVVFGSGYLIPVARRWKGQISELAKAWAQFEALPEADHNSLAGLNFPEDLMPHTQAIFLQADSDHPRNQLRLQLTRQMFLMEGVNTDFVNATGKSPLSHIWTLVQFGDFTAFYLAMAYGVDPTPIELLVELKEKLKNDH
jgi:glucose/mannose-6-phosphate isomerase